MSLRKKHVHGTFDYVVVKTSLNSIQWEDSDFKIALIKYSYTEDMMYKPRGIFF